MKDLGQLFITGISGLQLNEEESEFIQKENIGGVILFANNYESPAQLAELINSIQSLRDENPLFIATDHEGGRVQRFKHGFTRIPSMAELANSASPKLCYELHSLIGKELSACGVNVNFSPVCDILTNPKNQVIGDRAFGDNEEQVTKFISSAIRGLHSHNIMSCAKHFPGHGSTSKDSHLELPYIKTSKDDLKDNEFRPFVKAVKSRVTFMMVAHLVVDAIDENLPCTLSPETYRIIREDLRFTKLIITDDMNMNALTDNFGLVEAAEKAFFAGADIVEYRDFKTCKEVYDGIKKIVEKLEDRSILIEKIDRIRKIKEEFFKDFKPTYIPKLPEEMDKSEFQETLDKLGLS